MLIRASSRREDYVIRRADARDGKYGRGAEKLAEKRLVSTALSRHPKPRHVRNGRIGRRIRDTRCCFDANCGSWASVTVSTAPNCLATQIWCSAEARVVVFCDGDFWHGRNWDHFATALGRRHNADYWIAKIARNRERDREHTARLENEGWLVFRIWEMDIMRNPREAARRVKEVVEARRTERA